MKIKTAVFTALFSVAMTGLALADKHLNGNEHIYDGHGISADFGFELDDRFHSYGDLYNGGTSYGNFGQYQ